ncbi:hypothetical protein Hanom_Chr15g01393491 [Helianthus anomalus]
MVVSNRDSTILSNSFEFQTSKFSFSYPKSPLIFLIVFCKMSTTSKPAGTMKRKSKPKNPLGPDQATINRKEEELQNLIENFAFLLTGVSSFLPLVVANVKVSRRCLTRYGIHISQVNALGLPWIPHFEFICQAQKIEPNFEMFNVFYYVTYTGGFYSFNSRTAGVLPCSRDPLKSLHD